GRRAGAGLHPAPGCSADRVDPHRVGRLPAAALPAGPDRPDRQAPLARRHHRRGRPRRAGLVRVPHPAQHRGDGAAAGRRHGDRGHPARCRLHDGAARHGHRQRAHRAGPGGGAGVPAPARCSAGHPRDGGSRRRNM
ncbi:MAG: RsbS, negative regulator of sigma-B, partial [uncultured Friedmanniella sp.]